MCEKLWSTNMLSVGFDKGDFDNAPIIGDPGDTCPSCGADGLIEIIPDHTEEFTGIQCVDCNYFARVKTLD